MVQGEKKDIQYFFSDKKYFFAKSHVNIRFKRQIRVQK